MKYGVYYKDNIALATLGKKHYKCAHTTLTTTWSHKSYPLL